MSFAWSFSKLKNYETCPRRYEQIDLKKLVSQPKTQELDRGDELHAAMYKRVVNHTPLPAQFIYMEPWAERLTRQLHPEQMILGELKLSIDPEGNPTSYFDKTAWLRTKIDYFRLMPTNHPKCDVGHIVDYKTGRPPKVSDNTQLLINAYIVFQHYKMLSHVRIDYLWTEYNDTSHETFTRKQAEKQFAEILPRVVMLEFAHKTNEFPPTPNGLCKDYCPVSSCEYFGKSVRRVIREDA